MTAYYNENDPYAAQWLRNLIEAGHIAPGDVDERSIVDVRADDLCGYDQAHFFAGIGGWSVALRLAGWPDDRSVWTGSCPCQPFSAAGAGKAADDERHLWPAWFPLIAERRPAIVFGEQVEAAIGWGWLDVVFADLEAEGYACGATVLPTCGVGAPHIRQRCWFVADASSQSIRSGRGSDGEAASKVCGEEWEQRFRADNGASGATRDLAHAEGRGFGEFGDATQPRRGGHPDGGFIAGELDNPDDTRSQGRRQCRDGTDQRAAGQAGMADILMGDAASDRQRQPRFTEASERRPRQAGGSGAWRDIEFIPCTDGKARPVEPGTFPLAHGIPGRVGRLRAYGNAIVPQVAAEFIIAADEAMMALSSTQSPGADWK